jgi:hypothetical protein
MPNRRVLVFVDESNVVSSVRALGRKLDWIKLRDHLTNANRGRELIEMVVYVGLPPPVPEWQSEREKKNKFLHWLRSNGFLVVVKEWLSRGWQALQSKRGRVAGHRCS